MTEMGSITRTALNDAVPEWRITEGLTAYPDALALMRDRVAAIRIERAIGFVPEIDRRQQSAAIEPQRPGQDSVAIKPEACVVQHRRVVRLGEHGVQAWVCAAKTACAASRPVWAPPFI